MSQHVVWIKYFGYGEIQETLTFDTMDYSEADVKAMFTPFQSVSKKGFIYTAYEYNGKRIYSYNYVGVFPDDKIPTNNDELWDYRLSKRTLGFSLVLSHNILESRFKISTI